MIAVSASVPSILKTSIRIAFVFSLANIEPGRVVDACPVKLKTILGFRIDKIAAEQDLIENMNLIAIRQRIVPFFKQADHRAEKAHRIQTFVGLGTEPLYEAFVGWIIVEIPQDEYFGVGLLPPYSFDYFFVYIGSFHSL